MFKVWKEDWCEELDVCMLCEGRKWRGWFGYVKSRVRDVMALSSLTKQ
jgi:hypothetical protein